MCLYACSETINMDRCPMFLNTTIFAHFTTLSNVYEIPRSSCDCVYIAKLVECGLYFTIMVCASAVLYCLPLTELGEYLAQ